MKTIASFSDFSQDGLEASLFLKLWDLFPESHVLGPHGNQLLRIRISVDDARLKIAEDLLQVAGYRAWSGNGARASNEYGVILRALYEAQDWEAAELVHPSPEAWFPEHYRDNAGIACIEINSSLNKAAMGQEIVGLAGHALETLLVSQNLRVHLEQSKLSHLTFRPVLAIDEDSSYTMSWPTNIGRYWELSSDFILPPAVRSNLRTQKGEPYVGDSPQGCEIVATSIEGASSLKELHYRRGDLANIEPFGLALTNEQFRPGIRFLVASKDFYHFCNSRKLGMKWIPVRIDD
jgi:hypothetical protein